MRKSVLGLWVVAGLAGFFPEVHGEISETKQSDGFNLCNFEGDSAPKPLKGDLKDWKIAAVDGNNCYEIVQDGEAGLTGRTSQLKHSVGWTYEIRFKVVADAPSGNTFNIMLGDGVTYYGIGLNGGGIDDLFGSEYKVDLTDGFHELRIAQTADAADQRVYLDGKELFGFMLISGSGTANCQWFGDASGKTIAGGHILVDYMRMDNSGAYAPPSQL